MSSGWARRKAGREPLNTVKKRNLEKGTYHKHDARREIDINGFAEFTASEILEAIETEF
ncbi:hypothetical protein [Haladaptatus sp. DYSN1]|uniref:hypothetical protein n=1 Tax=unclassified Haladaptatus TaxID=2622732 RepID=UPI002404E0E5|nr:hypothetical protein [Haladaptatus sp. DYSN1]